MLNWVILFFVFAIIAGVFGFTGLAVTFADIARILFFLFIILFIVSLFMHLTAGRPPRP